MNVEETKPGWIRRGSRPRVGEIGAGIALSLLFHTLVAAALVVSAFWSPDTEEQQPEEQPEEIEFQDVELLALGEPPDPDQLPRITGDEGAPPDTDDVVPDPQVDPEPDPSPQPDEQPDPDPADPPDDPEPEQAQTEPEERQQQRRDEQRRRQMDEALGRFEQQGPTDEAPEGHPDGVPGGTTADPDAADLAHTYQARLLDALERHWEIPAVISDSEVRQLSGVVSVSVDIDESGHVQDYEFREESGNDQFDNSIERVLREFEADGGGETLPLPEDDELHRQIVEQRLILSNWEDLEQ